MPKKQRQGDQNVERLAALDRAASGQSFTPAPIPSPVYQPCPGPNGKTREKHTHYEGSTVYMSVPGSTVTTVVSVWVERPDGFKVCRVCGRAQGRYGRKPARPATERAEQLVMLLS